MGSSTKFHVYSLFGWWDNKRKWTWERTRKEKKKKLYHFHLCLGRKKKKIVKECLIWAKVNYKYLSKIIRFVQTLGSYIYIASIDKNSGNNLNKFKHNLNII